MKKRLLNWALIALTVVLIHDVMLVLGCLMVKGTASWDGLKTLVLERLTMPGDAPRYLQIAREGYVTEGADAINLVFYPLYPFLMRIFSFGVLDLAAVGMAISRLSLMGAGIALYELIKVNSDEEAAWTGVLMMAVYPFSMFTVGVYTESLFLFLTIGCMLAIRKEKIPLAGVIGFLAALTRVQGMLLIFPAVYYAVAGALQKENRRKIKWTDAAVFLIPMGFAVYLMINYHLHGNAFQFLLYEEGEPWYQTTKWVGTNIAQQYQNAIEFAGLEIIIYWPQMILFFVAAGILLVGIKENIRMEYLLYGAVYLGFTYLSGWMISGGRYMLCCFPCFMVLSQMKKGRKIALAISAVLFAVYSYFFLAGYAIM